MKPKHILLLDIDGLRPDVLAQARQNQLIPNLANLFGGPSFDQSVQIFNTAPAPSITFCSQACLFTGEHPKAHGIPGNQFFDRFGVDNDQTPRHYAFDIGDTLAVDDAVLVFTHGLAAGRLQVPTYYEKVAARGWQSVVAGNMYGKGATWLTPSLVKMAQFIKGKNLFGMASEEYDQHVVDDVLAYLQNNDLPEVLTVYFMGVDHDSHIYGTQAQLEALRVVDKLVGQVVDAVQSKAKGAVLVAMFSDHGQIDVIPDDHHALRIGFPFDRELGYFFDALGLDVHDYPGEDPACDAVLALNGGVAGVYLHNKTGHWWDKPQFERDVLPIAQAFWEAHQTGRHAADLKNSLSGVLVRNVEKGGWETPYLAYTPNGKVVSLEEWFSAQPAGLYVDPVHRLNNYAGRFTGDILLLSHYEQGYYFGKELKGMHGGLHPHDSEATLLYGALNLPAGEWATWAKKIETAIQARCEKEGGRRPSTPDMLVGVEAAAAEH